MSPKKKSGIEKKLPQSPLKKVNNLRISLSREQKNDKEKVIGSQIAKLDGAGAIAQGQNAKAVGQGGVLIEGDFQGNIFLGKTSDLGKEDAIEKKRLSNAFQGYVQNLKSQMESIKKSESSTTPYKALSEYEFRDAAIFFGREEMTKKLINHINQNALTVLYADSGAGKSSLLQAGVEPHLVSLGHVPLYIRPIDVPVHQKIKQSILPQLSQSPLLAQASLRDFLQLVTSQLKKDQWLVIIVDQFEEFFTLQNDEDRQSFIKELAGCLSEKTLPVRWVLSLRGEWFYQLGEFQSVIRNLFENTILLRGLTRDEAAKVIIQPARKVGVDYEEQVINEILINLLGGPGSMVNGINPPQLQLVCSALFEKCGENKLITLEMFAHLGGTSGILQEHLERELKNFPGKQRVVAQQVLLALVSSKGNRNIRSKEEISLELSSKGTNTSGLEDILRQLVNRHLLRIVERNIEGIDVSAYELSHEYLVDKIELDTESQKQKIAREILEFKLKYNLQLTSSELNIIEPYKGVVVLSAKDRQLVQESKRNVLIGRLISLMASLLTLGAGFSLILGIVTAIISIIPQIMIQGYVSLFSLSLIGFSIYGFKRGWTKELLVSLGVSTGIAVNTLVSKYIPINNVSLNIFGIGLEMTSESLFWTRVLILLSLVYLGYKSITTIARGSEKSTRKRVQDSLLGLVFGAINGYLLIGTIWFYLMETGYTSLGFSPPIPGTIAGDAALLALKYLPPHLLGGPGIYFAVLLILIFVIMVYV